MTVLDLPPAADDAEPVILPGLLSGLGIIPRPVPAWVTDPELAASIQRGLMVVDDDFMAVDEPTLEQIQKRIAGWACFCLAVIHARVAQLEQQLARQTAAH